ncbi:Nucleolar protein 10 [Aphelenchoides fujianensis]|nr:Nucleolar protein 10 [Aphelenchoides fujianensis]
MYLQFYLDDAGRRVYTLQKTDPNGKNTFSAHPARFSESDKNSKYRLVIKKRFNLLPKPEDQKY